MEYWSNGCLTPAHTPSPHHPITPSLHHSITPPLHHSNTPSLLSITSHDKDYTINKNIR